MNNKKGAEQLTWIIMVTVMFLLFLAIFVPYLVGKLGRGSEAISGVEQGASSKLKLINWDSLTSEEQKTAERGDPIKAAESKLQTAQTRLDNSKFSDAITLAQEVARSEGISKELIDRANELIQKAQVALKLSQELQNKRQIEFTNAIDALSNANDKIYAQALESKYKDTTPFLISKEKPPNSAEVASVLEQFTDLYKFDKVNRLPPAISAVLHGYNAEVIEKLLFSYSYYNCDKILNLRSYIFQITDDKYIITKQGDKLYPAIYNYYLGVCYFNIQKYNFASPPLGYFIDNKGFSQQQKAEDYYYSSLAKTISNAIICDYKNPKAAVTIEGNCKYENDEIYLKLRKAGAIELKEYQRMVCYLHNGNWVADAWDAVVNLVPVGEEVHSGNECKPCSVFTGQGDYALNDQKSANRCNP